MGGNLLKNWDLEEKRLNREDFHRVEKLVIGMLWSICPTIGKIETIPSYGAKETFGDLDLIVGVHKTTDNLSALIESRVGHKPHLNGEVLSFPYDGFQIDLILVRMLHPAHFAPTRMAKEYLSYNDASNLVGAMAAKMGLQFGHKGLFLKVSERMLGRDSDNIVASIKLSHNPVEIRAYMGMDENLWSIGFHSLEDIFDWISLSKWFNKDVYLLENTNHKHRLRNKKRPTYQAFQEWLKATNHPDNYVFNEDPTYYFDDIVDSFPDITQELETLRNELACNDAIRAKFNGALVSELTGLCGQELGSFMKYLTDRFGDRKDALYMSPAKVKDWIMYWHRVYLSEDSTAPFIIMNGLVYGYNNTEHTRKFISPSVTLTRCAVSQYFPV